ncbi:MAG: glycoside hydrolase family 18 protein [Treponema sp.]|jgi:chitinase|nr:glycoside hydrolase family 18 protein [Treponema sp.]
MAKRIFYFSLITLVCACLWFYGCASMTNNETAIAPRVSCYIRTWPIPEAAQKGGSPYWNAGMIKGEYLTDIIISFALLDKNDVSLPYIPELRPLEDIPMFTNIWDEIASLKEKYPHLKVNVSVGGFGADGFSDMANDSNLRKSFIANVCKWLEGYNLDGIDIDWEYPVGPEWGQEIKSRPADKQNYITLLRDLRNALDELGIKTGKRYGLSTAVPASGWFPKANDIKAAAGIVDSLKLMSYDYYGGWSATTGHHTNLSNNPHDPAWGGWSTEQALDEYLWAGVPPEKIMLGVGFYGHAWQGVTAGDYEDTPGLYQPYKSVPKSQPFDEGSISWTEVKKFLQPGSGYKRYWDDIAKAPYIYNGDIWISYTDQQQIKLLTDFVKEKKLGGVFVWEYGHDMEAELMKVLAENAQ